jgi:DNA end-binding protein Ku
MEEIVRGFEYEKGRYVVLRDEDFADLPLSTAKTVEILSFVELREIDPVYFNRSYYLAPGDGGQKAYELLKQAMRDANKVAVAKVAIRSKEALAALRVYQDVILLETMFYPDEIRAAQSMPELDYQVQVHENEVKMAASLIESLTENFQPEKYQNEYRQALQELIAAKIAGKEVEAVPTVETGKVVDLMEALKASIQLAKEEKARPKGRKKKYERNIR